MVTDYIQAASAEYPEKICCTVYAGNVNIGEALISKGLAKAVRHRQDDEQRSSHYGMQSDLCGRKDIEIVF